MNVWVKMLGALAVGSVGGLLAERWTWWEPVDQQRATQETIIIPANVDANGQESTPVPLDEMLAHAVVRMDAKDDRGAAGIALRWISAAKPEQLRGFLEIADFAEQLNRYRVAARDTALYRWAEVDGDAARVWAAGHAEDCTQFAAWLPWLKRDRDGALANLQSEEMLDVHQAALSYLAVTDEDSDLAGIIASGAENLGAWLEVQMLRGIPVQQIIAAIEGIPDLDGDQKRALMAGLVKGSDLTAASWSLILNSFSDPELKSLAQLGHYPNKTLNKSGVSLI
jgi:hypothetical protein